MQSEKSRTKVVQGLRQKRWPLLKSIRDFCYFSSAVLSLSACSEVGYLLWDPLCLPLSLFCRCLWMFGHDLAVITWTCWRKPQLSCQASFGDFFLPPALLYGNQSTPNPWLLFQCYILCVAVRAEVGRASKSWGCSFLTAALSADSCLSPVPTVLPTQKHQGNKKD